jgi:hypothetical protein
VIPVHGVICTCVCVCGLKPDADVYIRLVDLPRGYYGVLVRLLRTKSQRQSSTDQQTSSRKIFVYKLKLVSCYCGCVCALHLPCCCFAPSFILLRFQQTSLSAFLCNFLLMKLLLRWPRHTKQTPRLPVVIVFILHSPETFGAFSRDSSPVRRGRYRPAFLCGCACVCVSCSVDFLCNPSFRV